MKRLLGALVGDGYHGVALAIRYDRKREVLHVSLHFCVSELAANKALGVVDLMYEKYLLRDTEIDIEFEDSSWMKKPFVETENLATINKSFVA